MNKLHGFLCFKQYNTMSSFELTILGCGSALPTVRHMPPAQVVRLRDKTYMIDCGEGTQLQLRRMRISFSKINHVFITHAHGDHCLGIPGMLLTFALLGRVADLHIYGPKDVALYVEPLLETVCQNLPFIVHLHTIDPTRHEKIMEDRSIEVYSIPLIHRVPTCGYLLREKPLSANLKKEMVDFYQIPIKLRQGIKDGDDYVTPEGKIIPNSHLTRPARKPVSYAYCSDTLFNPSIVPYIEKADLLYHEATFLESDRQRAKTTCHSTTTQAAEIARLAQVRKLIIGHFSARYENDQLFLDEALPVFPDTILAYEGLTYRIK